jgi:kinetochore protein Fta7
MFVVLDIASFPQLEPRTVRIPRSQISTKWNVLPDSSHAQLRDIFRSVERPVVMKFRDERKRVQAEAAIGSLVKRLERKLPRMPFPPGSGRDTAGFGFEKTLDSNVCFPTPYHER